MGLLAVDLRKLVENNWDKEYVPRCYACAIYWNENYRNKDGSFGRVIFDTLLPCTDELYHRYAEHRAARAAEMAAFRAEQSKRIVIPDRRIVVVGEKPSKKPGRVMPDKGCGSCGQNAYDDGGI